MTIVALGISSPGHALCGHESCEPSAGEIRAKVERLVASAWLTPHAIATVQRFDDRSSGIDGQEKREVRVLAVINYYGDKLLCRTKFCPELNNYLVKVDEAAKKVTIAGWLFFEQTKGGWR